MYSPETEDVTFRLELYDQSGRTVTESTRALASIPADQSADSGVHQSQSRPAAKQVHGSNRSTGVPTPSSKHSTDSASERASAPHASTHEGANSYKGGRTISAAERKPTHIANGGQLLSNATPSGTRPVERRRDTATSNLLARNVESPPPASAPATSEISSVTAKTRPSPPVFVPPQPVQKPPPRFRQVGTVSYSVTDVTVLVHIDPNGRVATARLDRNSNNVSRPLALAALDAAKQWTFEPARLHGNNVESDYMIVFRFVPPSR
jgi:TonB family protein